MLVVYVVWFMLCGRWCMVKVLCDIIVCNWVGMGVVILLVCMVYLDVFCVCLVWVEMFDCSIVVEVISNQVN